MNVGQRDNAVLAMDVARDDQELLVVTENGYGKRTSISEYPAKGRGTMGVLTIRYTEARGRLAGAMVVKDGYDLMLISHDGTVIRTAADGISRMGRATQGVRLMNLREGDRVSAIARVTEPQGATTVDGNGEAPDDGAELPACDGEPIGNGSDPADDDQGNGEHDAPEDDV